ncbi:hypothetical protein HPB50_006427 [Hyalomma asiaticum]|uniref:Uncharacterized protein n=1 Tax=Hyalomma asiaticum TaxID=266040 RepID=A0ACB7S7I5_HYAAI|nr:hypothetical protein HPB50_006427 [Hyalomma asiaticum]
MAGYIFYKAEEDGPVQFTGSEPTSPKKAKAPAPKRQKRRNTQPTMGPQNAPLEAEADDDEADDGEKADGEGAAPPPDVATTNADKDDMFNGDPSCTTTHELYKCEGDEQLQMFLSHFCLSNGKGTSCFQWQPQQFCLTSQTNRFRTLQDCQDKCNGNQNCGMAATCQCSGMYRKVNYIYDMRRQRCRLIPLHECVEVDVGFVDNDECQSVCGKGVKKRHNKWAGGTQMQQRRGGGTYKHEQLMQQHQRPKYRVACFPRVPEKENAVDSPRNNRVAHSSAGSFTSERSARGYGVALPGHRMSTIPKTRVRRRRKKRALIGSARAASNIGGLPRGIHHLYRALLPPTAHFPSSYIFVGAIAQPVCARAILDECLQRPRERKSGRAARNVPGQQLITTALHLGRESGKRTTSEALESSSSRRQPSRFGSQARRQSQG